MKILIKYPTRGRPQLFRQTLGRYRALLSGKHDVQFSITADANDAAMNTPAMNAWLFNSGVGYRFGASKTKIEAVNADIPRTPWDVLILASDDQSPEALGYDDAIATAMRLHYPDGDGCLWFDDGKVGRALCTLPIMGRKYWERFGYIYHPAYISLWADNEQVCVAQALGKIRYDDRVLIRHRWDDVKDDLRKQSESYYRADEVTFNARQQAGFPHDRPTAEIG